MAGVNFQDILSGLGETMGNRNVLRTMSQVGTQMDPEGAGGFLGQPATQLIEALAAQEAQARQDDMLKRLLEVLGGESPQTEGISRDRQEGRLESGYGMVEEPAQRQQQPMARTTNLTESGGWDSLMDDIFGETQVSTQTLRR